MENFTKKFCFMISIHALREEGDKSSCRYIRAGCNFYPRPPRGGRRDKIIAYKGMDEFLSTPSARRATCGFSWLTLQLLNFYPRPPRGGRRTAAQAPDA